MKQEYLEAVDKLENEYDAFYIGNKYGDGTHKKEFELLANLKGDKVPNALGWIKNCYDCYYKYERGYFKGISDTDMKLGEILENCEVVEG